MTKDGTLSPQGLEALRSRFEAQSRKAQAYYTVMHRARDITGNDDAASAWMNAPLEKFDGKTPAQLVAEGRADDVLRHIDAIAAGSAG
ncbi:MAG TPA: MbcA/ParS/Xre antitoxin family protein [Noviherbaspirillum sp.]|nr:MbcA/ParS/Xre antitoxin family protein [Noviherbaspirillum sp.]